MELPWLIKIRMALAIALGVVLIGFLAWPIAKPAQPFGIVTFPNLINGIILLLLSLISALIAYLLCWPYGKYIAVITVPAGLAIWAARTGSIASQLQQLSSDAAVRRAFFAPLKWEAFLWLIIVFAGFAGVLIGRMILPSKKKALQDQPSTGSKSDSDKGILAVLAQVINPYKIEFKKSKSKPQSKSSDSSLNVLIALVGSILIAHICLPVLAQDVEIPDAKLGVVVGQPAVAQIIFAVLVSFGIAGFVFKYFLNSSFIWPILSCAFLMIYTHSVYTKQAVIEYMAGSWPAVFLPSSTLAILPVQMVAIAALGAIVGYWLAIRFNYWKTHELKR